MKCSLPRRRDENGIDAWSRTEPDAIAAGTFEQGNGMNAPPRLVLWGSSLNGVFSVLASVGAIYCAIYMGTTRTFAIAQ